LRYIFFIISDHAKDRISTKQDSKRLIFHYEDSLSRGLILKLIIIYSANKHDASELTLTRMHETNIIFSSLTPFSETILPRETTRIRGSLVRGSVELDRE